MAILSARWRATGGAVNHDGDTTRLVAYATSQAHSSIEKGLRIAGIGTDRIRIVAHDEHFAMRPDALADDDRRRPCRRARSVLRLLDPWHHLVDGVRPDRRDRPDLRTRARLAARRRGDVGHRRARTGAPLGERRPGVRRLLLHEPAQVDGRQLRLRPVLDGRPRRPARRAEHPAGVPPLRGRRGGCRHRLPRLADPARPAVPGPQAVVRDPVSTASSRSRR